MDHIIIERRPGEERLKRLGLSEWREWAKEESEFTRHYGSDELCYFLEGKAVLVTDDGCASDVEEGDLLIISAGTSCTWKIRKRIKTLYGTDHLYNLFI